MSEPVKSYEELRSELGNLPATWYPDLIRAMIESAIKKNVFKPNMIAQFVSQVETKIRNDDKH